MANMTNYDSKTGNVFMITTDEIAVGASKRFFDMFNSSGSGYVFYIYAIYALPKSDVAVTGAVSARFDLYRTSSVGTGGTGVAYKSVLPNVPTCVPFDTVGLDPTFTDVAIGAYMPAIARSAPTGGSAIAHYLTRTYLFTEETNAQITASQFFSILPNTDDTPPLVLREGEGLLIQQGSVASVNSFTFRIVFALAKEG